MLFLLKLIFFEPLEDICMIQEGFEEAVKRSRRICEKQET
jgi:hypothetical protein